MLGEGIGLVQTGIGLGLVPVSATGVLSGTG